MPPAARVGDMHTCPMVTPGTPPVPHVGGPILPPGSPTVLVGFMPAARVGDMAVCVGPPDTIAKGSLSVLIGGKPAARIGDMTAHGGTIVVGCPTVMIGDSSGGAGGSGGAAKSGSSSATTPQIGYVGPGMATDFATAFVVAGPTAAAFTDAAQSGDALVQNEDPANGPAPGGVPKTYEGITIDGDDAFRKKTIEALDGIKKTPTGAKLLESLKNGGKPITIRPSTTGNGASPIDARKAVRKTDGTRGEGTGSIVSFNPDRRVIGDGSEPWHTRPPGVGLAHELIHANHSARGTNNFTAEGEDMAVGLGTHAHDAFTENKIRDEWNPKQPTRTHY